MGIIAQYAACIRDHRDDPARIDYRVDELVAQRVYGLALGYEDLNDHAERVAPRCAQQRLTVRFFPGMTGNRKVR